MKKYRVYGNGPYKTAVLHGGPGAPGEMAPVARELSPFGGVLEPIQTAGTIEGQIRELERMVTAKGNPPVTLIGWSWGAWLAFIFAARIPGLVKKLILIGSGPFEDKYAQTIMDTRLKRMNEEERGKTLFLIELLEDSAVHDKDDTFRMLGRLISKADSYDPIPHKSCILGYQFDIYQSIWGQASRLRRSGKLLEYGEKIHCPVVAIHGDFDPHPAEGVRRPLSRTLKDFRFILLDKCGHTPWLERKAHTRFYGLLREELI